MGIAAAWALSRGRGAANQVLETLLALPLVLPPTAVGLLLLGLLRRSGPIGRLLDSAGIEVLFTWKAVALATAVMSFPLLVRPARAAFESVDPRLLAIARSLGKNPAAVFREVALPLSWRGVLAGTLLAFSRALGEFGATILVAGNIPGRTTTIATAIYSDVQTGLDGRAYGLLAVSAALAFGAIFLSEVWLKRRTNA